MKWKMGHWRIWNMMTLLLISIFLTELIKYGIWFKGIHKLPLVRWRLGGVAAGSYLLLLCGGAVTEKTVIIVWNIVSIMIFAILTDCIKNKIGIMVIKSFFIVVCLDEIVMGIFQLIAKVTVRMELSSGIQLKICYLFNNVVIILMFLIMNRIKKRFEVFGNLKLNKFHKGIVCMAVVIMGASIFLAITGFQDMISHLDDEKLSIFPQIVSIVSFICIECLIMMISYILSENKRYKIYVEKDKMLLKTQRNMYEAMLAKNKAIRIFQHDIYNHLMCMNELIADGEMLKVQNYIESIVTNLHSIQNKAYTVGNSVVDAVLNYYISMLNTGIKVDVSGECPSNIDLDDVELCAIVSNLIQNAVEALNESDTYDNYIKIKFESNKEYMYMKIINNYFEKSFVRDKVSNMPKTTKVNVEEHGIGLRSIKETIEKHNGVFRIDINSETFAAEVILPLY